MRIWCIENGREKAVQTVSLIGIYAELLTVYYKTKSISNQA